jgi:hypothetical protein
VAFVVAEKEPQVVIRTSNDEVERRGVELPSNEGTLSKSSTPSCATDDAAPRSLEPIVRRLPHQRSAHFSITIMLTATVKEYAIAVAISGAQVPAWTPSRALATISAGISIPSAAAAIANT